MKMIPAIIGFVLCLYVGNSQQILQKTFNDISPQQTLKTSDAGFLVAGLNATLLKIDSNYNQQWVKSYTDSIFTTSFFKVIELSNGTYLMSGQSNYISQGTWYTWLLQTDTSGNILKTITYNGVNVPQRLIPIENADGTITVAGSQLYSPFGSGDPEEHFLLMKLDTSLNVIWAKNYYFMYQEYFTDIILDSNGNYILQAYSFDSSAVNDYRSDILVMKIDTAGTIIWAKQCGNFVAGTGMGNGIATVYDKGKILEASDGTIFNGFSVGWYQTTWEADIVWQKLDPIGNEIESHEISHPVSSSSDLITSAQLDSNSGISFLNFVHIIKLDNNLNTIFSRRLIPYLSNWTISVAKEILSSNDSSFVCMGLVADNNSLISALLTVTDSSYSLGCQSFPNMTYSNLIKNVPNINIDSLITDSIAYITDSALTFNLVAGLLFDSVLCNTQSGLNPGYSNLDDVIFYANILSGEIIIANDGNDALTLNIFDIIGKKVLEINKIERGKK
jgi:hypothetical protein